MSTYIVRCRRCHVEFEPDRRAIVSGSWRLCESCRVGNDTPQGPAVCPRCHQVLKSGTHHGLCPGRRRRNRGVADR
jgi:hypothetical protein